MTYRVLVARPWFVVGWVIACSAAVVFAAWFTLFADEIGARVVGVAMLAFSVWILAVIPLASTVIVRGAEARSARPRSRWFRLDEISRVEQSGAVGTRLDAIMQDGSAEVLCGIPGSFWDTRQRYGNHVERMANKLEDARNRASRAASD